VGGGARGGKREREKGRGGGCKQRGVRSMSFAKKIGGVGGRDKIQWCKGMITASLGASFKLSLTS
jgi:hypothetical protein